MTQPTSPEELARLLSGLSSPDAVRRREDAKALAQVTDSNETIVTALERVVASDTDPEVREAARAALSVPVHQAVLARRTALPPAPSAGPSVPTVQQKTIEERKALLAQQLQFAVARGGRIESQSDTMAVVVYGKPVNHVLHFLIGLVTFGLWWIVWLILAASGGEKREMITIDEFGNMLTQKA